MTIAKFCPSCGHPTDGAKFCPECGASTAIGGTASAGDAPPPAAVLEEDERELWTGSPDAVLDAMNARSTRYTLTTERIRALTGLIGKRSEQLDLFRVKDVRVTRGLAQRARGCGHVAVLSSDKTTPEMVLYNVKDPDNLAELIRKTAREARQRAGVKMQEYV